MGCSCGSTNVHAEPGAFGEMGSQFGFSRFWCRDCRRHFWLRKTAAWVADSSDDTADAANEQATVWRAYTDEPRDTSLSALDSLATPAGQTNAPPDLRALDRRLQQSRRPQERKAEKRRTS